MKIFYHNNKKLNLKKKKKSTYKIENQKNIINIDKNDKSVKKTIDEFS